MLNTLIRDTLIDLANKRYGKVTMVLSELAKPGVWKDKLVKNCTTMIINIST